MDAASGEVLFAYEPLPDPHTHFRLLKILQGGFQQHVVCELSIWSIEQAPPYIAVSYTWGDPKSTSKITINKKQLTVRRNCEYVLQQQAYAGRTTTSYVWVDAICIDQKGLQERNHQVALMGTIYGKAANVAVCVGPHADESECLMRTLKRKAFALSHIHRCLLQRSLSELDSYESSKEGWSAESPKLGNPLLQSWCVLAMRRRTRRRLAKAYFALLRRSYFSRVWVLQELFLGREATLFCGSAQQPFGYFLAFNKVMSFWLDYKKLQYHEIHFIVDLCILSPVRLFRFPRRTRIQELLRPAYEEVVAQRSFLNLAARKRQPYQLIDVILAMEHFECADERDRVYGALSLVYWRKDTTPFPDYKKETFVLATEILSLALSRKQRWYSFLKGGRYSTFALTTHLRTMLKISPDQSSLQAAIHARSGHDAKHWTMGHTHASTKLSSSSEMDTVWYGILLSYRLGDLELGDECNCSVRTFGGSKHPVAYLPEETREGDWLLQLASFDSSDSVEAMYPQLGHPNVSIVVRPLSSGQYTIIGQAYPVRQGNLDHCVLGIDTLNRRLASFRKFHVYWDAEDLLVLEWQHSLRESIQGSSKAISEWLKVRGCIREGSSYAIGPFEVSRIEIDHGDQAPDLFMGG